MLVILPIYKQDVSFHILDFSLNYFLQRNLLIIMLNSMSQMEEGGHLVAKVHLVFHTCLKIRLC